jgi:hypothetical protein
LVHGPPGSWDNIDVNFPCVIYDGTSYHMYYGNTMGIGYATSPNGIDWTKDTVHNPIHYITPGTFYSSNMFPSGAVLYNDTVHMWFTGRGGYPTTDNLGYGYSTDFYSFTWYTDTAMSAGPMDWERRQVGHPWILEINGKYRSWYSGANLSLNMFKIGAAELPVPSCVPVYFTGCENGDGFKDFILEEIQNTGSGCENLNGTGWSKYHNLGPAEILPGETYVLKISSNNDMQYATIWVDWNRNEEFEVEERVIDTLIEQAGTLYELDFIIPQEIDTGFYNMRAKTNCNAFCYDACKNYLFGETEDYLLYYPPQPPPPGIHEIRQLELGINPNPFNTNTTLSFRLSKPENVQFTVYNVQSKIVYTIEERRYKGRQEIQWNAEGLPAGMYYYRIQAGDKVGGGKMVKVNDK